MSIQKYPCADCPDCIAIGEGEGLCNFSDVWRPMVVNLFDIHPECPKPKTEELKTEKIKEE